MAYDKLIPFSAVSTVTTASITGIGGELQIQITRRFVVNSRPADPGAGPGEQHALEGRWCITH